jgi:hypothetical protein
VWDNLRVIARERFREGLMPPWFKPEWLDIEEAPTNTWWRQQGLSAYRTDTTWLGESAPTSSSGGGGGGSGGGGSGASRASAAAWLGLSSQNCVTACIAHHDMSAAVGVRGGHHSLCTRTPPHVPQLHM